jgi:hypothetical protein
MADPDDPQPSSASNLDSAEYRERLRRKLETLIAVLEAATAKVKQSLAGPAPDVARLTRIQKNLRDTLEVCLRARAALDQRGQLPASLSKDLAAAVDPTVVLGRTPPRSGAPSLGAPSGSPTAPASARHGHEVELSERERAKFAQLPRIDRSMIGACDLDELARLLQR